MDVSDPSSPQRETSAAISGGLAQGIVISQDDSTIYVAAGLASVKIFDVTASPTQIGQYNTTSFVSDVSLHPNGDILYVSTTTSFLLLNVSDSNEPTLISEIALQGGVNNAYPLGDSVILVEGSSGFQVVDVTDVKNPNVDSTVGGTNVVSVAFDTTDSKLYAAGSNLGIPRVGIFQENGAALTLTGNLTTKFKNGQVNSILLVNDGSMAILAVGNSTSSQIEVHCVRGTIVPDPSTSTSTVVETSSSTEATSSSSSSSTPTSTSSSTSSSTPKQTTSNLDPTSSSTSSSTPISTSTSTSNTPSCSISTSSSTSSVSTTTSSMATLPHTGAGQTDNLQSGANAPAHSSNSAILSGVVGGVGAVIVLGAIVAVILFFLLRKKKRPQDEEEQWNPSVVEDPKEVPFVDTITDIKIIRELGSGSFGTVYLGSWQGGTPVALKKLTSADHWAEFRKEASMLQSLSHPNIVTFHGIFMTDDDHYIVTEYMEHGSLLGILQNGDRQYSIIQLLDMAIAAAQGMVYLESKGVVHRDLACRNLLVTIRDGKFLVKIADFGMSRHTTSNSYYMPSSEVVIPIKWSAVELLRQGSGANKFSTKSDVWSFGVVMWEIMEQGTEPWAWLSNQDTFFAIDRGDRLPQPREIPAELWTLMHECWREVASQRPTFAEIASTLRSIRSRCDPKTPNSLTKSFGHSPRKMKKEIPSFYTKTPNGVETRTKSTTEE
eukprot:TRINITY_DN1494_c1_g1_i2.p1 TRINITY_DN1494_c1_g1~~TRINITY_DN1494_c1_g1_i2.p1  ORF type:complete len:718 (-),score=249.77 TRINITY_DN1494_c1_g1_i2:9-2162(-)